MQVSKDNKVGQPIDRTLTAGHRYEATLVAYDSYGNSSPSRSFTFVAEMEITREALDAVAELANPVLAQLERVLGEPNLAEPQDFQVHVADPAEAQKLAASLTDLFEQDYAAQRQVDRAATRAQQQIEELNSQFSPVQRAVLERVIEGAEEALSGAAATGEDSEDSEDSEVLEVLETQVAEAKEVLGTLNLSQADIDAAAENLATALQEFEASLLDRSELVVAAAAAVAQADTVDRVLGVLTPAVAADYGLFIEDEAGAAEAAATVRALVAAAPLVSEYAQAEGTDSDAPTQADIDAAAQALSDATEHLAGFAVNVDRGDLQLAVQTHAELAAEANESTLTEAQPLLDAHRAAVVLLGELNWAQSDIDAAASDLVAAAKSFNDALKAKTPRCPKQVPMRRNHRSRPRGRSPTSVSSRTREPRECGPSRQ